jgi:hypothetical protein
MSPVFQRAFDHQIGEGMLGRAGLVPGQPTHRNRTEPQRKLQFTLRQRLAIIAMYLDEDRGGSEPRHHLRIFVESNELLHCGLDDGAFFENAPTVCHRCDDSC